MASKLNDVLLPDYKFNIGKGGRFFLIVEIVLNEFCGSIANLVYP